jgi:signal transduction histidine kinase
MIAGLTGMAELLLLMYYFYLRYKKKNKVVAEEQKIRDRQYEFVSMISHQLRTPIAAARSLLEILKDEKGFEQLNDVYVKIDHLNSIVATLLFFIENENVFGRKEMTTEKTADLAGVIRNQLEFLKKIIADKKIVVNVKIPEKLMLPVDEVLLNRMVYSLIENAIIYNKEFGTINITLQDGSKRPVLVIADSGYGIPAKEQASVFSSFFRATNASLALNEGSGLSLYITKEIMRLIGGSITFESSEGEGSTFYLNF